MKKYYFADVIQIKSGRSDLVGSCVQTVWFWQSSMLAYEMLTGEMKRVYGCGNQAINFRRVR